MTAMNEAYGRTTGPGSERGGEGVSQRWRGSQNAWGSQRADSLVTEGVAMDEWKTGQCRKASPS